jgi:hypothetical protein
MPVDRPVVLVNGLPAAGKSTLAVSLARALGLPLLSKDVIKETCAEVLGADPPPGWGSQREWSQALGAAAGESMWALLAHAYAGAVLESSWRADVRPAVAAGLARAGVAGLAGGTGVSGVAEVWCDAPLPLLRERYARRRSSRHPVHGPPLTSDEWREVVRHARPLAFGPVLRLDTSGPVDLPAVVAWCRQQRGRSVPG